MRALVLGFVAAILCAGCPPDLSGWAIVPSPVRDSAVVLDATLPDGAIRDTAVPPLDTGPIGPTTGGPCAPPYLLLAVESFGGGGGTIRRFEIGATELRECGPLTLGGGMHAQPFAVASIGETFTLIASADGVQGIEPRSDTLRFELPRSGQMPNDAFVLFDAGRGDEVIAVAWAWGGSGPRFLVQEVVTYTVEGAMRDTVDDSALMWSLVTSVTAHPRVRSELLAMDSTYFSAAEVDYYGRVTRRATPLVPTFADTVVRSVSALSDVLGVPRVVWTALVGGTSSVLTVDDPFSGAPMPFAYTCATPCDFHHAIPDPVVRGAMLALCEVAGQRSLVRVDPTGPACSTLLAAPPSGQRFSYLSIARASGG